MFYLLLLHLYTLTFKYWFTMLNTADFGKRIQLLMDYYSLSASAFADSLAIGRSSISHILSGRNKPSLDFVMKIIEAFPEVELEWLLYNKNTFPKQLSKKTTPSIQENAVIENSRSQEKIVPPQVETNPTDLFSEPNVITETKTNSIEKNEVALNSNMKESKKIDRIVIFYSDGTFDNYIQ